MMEYGIHAFTIEDAALLVARMDSNRSGKVNFKEFKVNAVVGIAVVVVAVVIPCCCFCSCSHC